MPPQQQQQVQQQAPQPQMNQQAPQQPAPPLQQQAPQHNVPPQQRAPRKSLLGDSRPQVQQAAFPAPWNDYFKIASGGSRRIVFTYVNLGLDLGGRPDNERRSMFKRMISYLGWPAGTAAFWPCSVLMDDVLTPNGSIFWQGVRQLGVKHIACFGKDALQILYPYANEHRDIIYKNNVAIHLLPDPDLVAGMNGPQKVQVVSGLKGLFPDLER